LSAGIRARLSSSAVVDQQLAQRQVAVVGLAAQGLRQVFRRQDAQRDQGFAQAQHGRAPLQLDGLRELWLGDQLDVDEDVAELQVADALLFSERFLQLRRR